MIALTWLRGLIAHRPARLLATALGVAVGVALIASIGTFLSATNAKMTQRAIARVRCRLAGAGPAGVRARPGALPGSLVPRRAQRTAGLVPDEPGLCRRPPPARPRRPAPRRCSVCRPATRRRFPESCGCCRAARTARCSPSRRRPTCTLRRARAVDRRAAGRPPRARAGRRRRRPARRRLAVSEGRRAAGRAAERPARQRAAPAAGRLSRASTRRSRAGGPS